MTGLPDKIVAVHTTLREAGFPHAFGGALALAWCTQRARGTIDIDVNVFVGVEEAAHVFGALPSGVAWSDADLDTIRRDGQVRLWWDSTPVDVFLNTTNIDNTPVSVLEAMACGLCVVSTNVGGIPYLLADGKDSLLVEPAKEEAMADAVRTVLGEPGLAGGLSRAARAKTESLDWMTILPQWEAMLASLTKDGGR